MKTTTKERLAYLRNEILQERISYSEIAELQALAEHIDASDTLLLEWAGVPQCTCQKITPELGNRLPNECLVHHVNCDCVGHSKA